MKAYNCCHGSCCSSLHCEFQGGFSPFSTCNQEISFCNQIAFPGNSSVWGKEGMEGQGVNSQVTGYQQHIQSGHLLDLSFPVELKPSWPSPHCTFQQVLLNTELYSEMPLSLASCFWDCWKPFQASQRSQNIYFDPFRESF